MSSRLEEALNEPKLIIWNTSTKIDLALRCRVEGLPYSKDSTEALILILQYLTKRPGCEIVSATLTQRGARVGVNWDSEDWTKVMLKSGIRDMVLDSERKFMAAKAK
ncbi:hypothetical protein BKA70DRAFT_1429204 [Coprinopsis sp. MPI-PUGE-AT-0042]|nr:hypothetical protein BKA70DRAFT_1429204 [Coprinopsis sp. MPI-PUGE-AT-0042]